MTGALAIEVTGLTKSYGKTPVLKGIDLSVTAGTVFALLGPNGAGKTTVVRILSTLTAPDGGQALVAGFDVCRQTARVRQRISLTGQYAALDEAQTGRENLEMIGRLRHLPRRARAQRALQLLERFDLAAAGGQRVSTYSGGMRRRLDLAAGLVVRPDVVFLDEPSTGLDLNSRHEIWAATQELAAAGTTIFLTTQYLEEADRLAGQVAVLDGGRIVGHGAPARLKQGLSTRRLVLTVAGHDAFDKVAARLGRRMTSSDANSLTVTVPLAPEGDAAEARALLDEIDPTRGLVTHFATQDASLDEVFLALTGHGPAISQGPPGSPRGALPSSEVI